METWDETETRPEEPRQLVKPARKSGKTLKAHTGGVDVLDATAFCVS